MNIEVTGVNTWNKGAELMLAAIVEHYQRSTPEVALVVDQFFGSYDERAKYGLHLKPSLSSRSRSAIGLKLVPQQLRRAAGIVAESEIDAVLDASGFAFSDQLPIRRIEDFAKRAESIRRSGRPLLLLPQAVGPFEIERSRAAFRRVATSATVVFARDRISFENAKRAAPEARILQAPDFTNLVKPELTPGDDLSGGVCVVPNQRMIEKAESRSDANSYVPLIVSCIEELERRGCTVHLLLHGETDSHLADQIVKEVGHALSVISINDPVEIKRELGRYKLVVGSRFHALASALSQGIPCIATSWSHKYEMLFQEYGCPEMILSVNASTADIRDKVETVLGQGRLKLLANLEESASVLEQRVQEMWDHVDALLGIQVLNGKRPRQPRVDSFASLTS